MPLLDQPVPPHDRSQWLGRREELLSVIDFDEWASECEVIGEQSSYCLEVTAVERVQVVADDLRRRLLRAVIGGGGDARGAHQGLLSASAEGHVLA
jgi:hypothetical protein